MKWKAKNKPEMGTKRYFNEYIFLFPIKFNGYWHWFCWGTFEETWIGFRWTRAIKMVAEGKKAKELNKTLPPSPSIEEQNILDMEIVINGGEALNGCPKDWDEAKEIQEWLNKGLENEYVGWSFDCGFKLDFDSPEGIVYVSSRFYPPKKHYGSTWDGKMTFYIKGKKQWEFSFDEPDLKSLKEKVEKRYKRQISLIGLRF